MCWGDHVQQKGSLVAADRLRFDFSHFEPATAGELAAIEQQVNTWVLANDEALTRVMPIEDAMNSGALALFGEKYDDNVRVLTLGANSTELCGGTHVSRTGDIGLVKVISETGVAAGVRRIEAVTGAGAQEWISRTVGLLDRVATSLKTDTESVESRLESLVARNRELEKELQSLRDKLASSKGEDLMDNVVTVDGISVLAARFDGVNAKALPNTLDQLKNRLGSGVLVIASVDGGRVNLIAGVTADLIDRVQAGPLVNHVALQVGGKGGGRPDMARAGGKDPANLDAALASVPGWIGQHC